MAVERELFEQAKNLTDRSARFFLVLPPALSPDTLASAEILSRRLRAAGKEAYLSQSSSLPGWEFLPVTSLTETRPGNQDVLITVDTKEAPVGELRYEKRDGALVIILSPKEKPIPRSAISINENPAKTDCIITIGVESLDVLGDLFQKNPRLFFETPIIAIDYSPAHDRHGEINLVDIKAGSNSEVAWQLASSIAPGSMNKEEATLILAGILEKTRNLSLPNLTPQTMALAAECVNRGARRGEILSRFAHNDSFSVLQLWGRVIIRSRILEASKMVVSIATADDFVATGTTKSDIPAVIHHLESHLPEAKQILFLWQDSKTKEIFAAVKPRGTKELLEIQRSIEGVMEASLFLPRNSFSSFVAAENTLIPLLAA